MQTYCDFCTRELYAGHDEDCPYYVPKHQRELIRRMQMANPTKASPTHAAQLKAAGCPDECKAKLEAAGFDWSMLAQLLALATQFGPQFWTTIQALLVLAEQSGPAFWDALRKFLGIFPAPAQP